jgi:hypothetical protein
MKLFERLRAARAFARRHMHFVEALEDVDLLLEIGFHQEQGTPLSMKQVYLLDIASVATVQRRLRRLRQFGAVAPRRSDSDARSVELVLSPKALKTYEKYAEVLGINGFARRV